MRVRAALAAGLWLVAFEAHATEEPVDAASPRGQAWLTAEVEIGSAPPPSDAASELAELRSIAAGRSPEDVLRAKWWDAGGPAYRWNEIAVDALVEGFVTLPMAARHLALVHAAIDDAVAAAYAEKQRFQRPRPQEVDPTLAAALPTPKSSSYPSDFAAAASAAADVLGYLFPSRAVEFSARAEEAMRSRLVAAVEYPSDVAAGREIGRRVASLAIARGKADGSDAKWAGSIPEGPGKWRGSNPIAPMAGTWRTWVLSRPDEFRPPAPPAFDSEKTRADLVELKEFPRTPKSNHRAVYWEVFGGARAYALWNETARLKLAESRGGFNAPAEARVFAALNIAFYDAAVACWDAKYAYWHIRPSQLDPELKTVFPPPNHPSYPAAHGCLSSAAATVLAGVFRADRERLLRIGAEAAEARVWAGIHYRADIDAGQELGRKVAEKTLARAFLPAAR
ncbi:MAG: phosphatase PAP2 family protein [Rhodospirillales bacterium]|nr:phosphatase PAP2 family protein [Rhodospirillales bacterium]